MTDWRNEPLSAVCEFINRGVSPKYLDGGGIAVLNQKCVRDHEVNYAHGRRHDFAAKKVAPERLLRAGDVLVNSTGTGTLGRVAQLREAPTEPTTVDSHVTIVRPIPTLFHPEFFGYAMIAIEEQIQAGGEGCGGQTELSRSKLAEEYRVGFPTDLGDQHRIVTLLDEAFADIATAKANADKNLQNARELFERYLNALFSQKGNGWEAKRLEDWCDSIMDCVNKTAPVVEEPTPFKMLRTTNIRNGRVDVTAVKFVSEETYKIWTRRQTPRHGDVILTREAPMGEVGMLLSEDKVFLGQRLVSYRTNPKVLNNNFLLLALQSSDLQNQIHAKASGSTVQHMRVPDTKNLLLAAPTLVRQREIVIELTQIRETSKRLESVYRQKLTALDDLKKSLLHQAFSGQL